MTQTVIEKALRVRILTGFTAIILLTIFIAGWSYFHISRLGSSAEHLFISNYRSIQYAHSMEQAINEFEKNQARQNPGAFADRLDSVFRSVLALEYRNITEPGELAITRSIENQYKEFLAAYQTFGRSDHQTVQAADQVVAEIEQMLMLNERAMFARAEVVKDEANFARISTLGITAVLVSIAILLAIAVSRRSLAEFRELDRAKSNFVATAAHELKNPLSSIKTSTGLLLEGIVGSLSEAQSEIVANMRLESERLLNLVRQLLDLARLETGTLALTREEIDVESIIESAILPVTLQSAAADVKIEAVVLDNVPKIVVDANKISWAIANILSNAIRYSPRGSSIAVTATRIENEVWISVTDQGKGIAAEDLTRIFQKFVQVEEGAMGGGSGSGLGLSIAQEVVQAHQGRVWATSTRGKGSTFTIAIPISEPSKYSHLLITS